MLVPLGMKLAVTFACSLVATVAHADPVRVAALDPASRADATLATTAVAHEPTLGSTAYLSTGFATGLDAGLDWLYSATSIDGGYHLSDGWWLHAELAGGARVGYGAINQGPQLVAPQRFVGDLRAGIEWRACGVVCGMLGVDAGYRVGHDLDGVMVAPRAGLDLGTAHLRFRPGLDLPVYWPHKNADSDVPFVPAVGLGLDLRVAYQW